MKLKASLPTAPRSLVLASLIGTLGLAWESHGGSSALSETVGVHKIVLTSGPNCVSVPFQRQAAFRGQVESRTASTITFSGTPGWTANQFGPRDGMVQYLVLVRKDASESPGVEGDWWHITANTAKMITVDNGGEDVTTILGVGDELEIARLTSIKDLFGAGGSSVLLKDSNFDVLTSEEDVIRFLAGVSFSAEVFCHDGSLGSAGYYLNGEFVGSGDGSTITLNPGQTLIYFRRTGAAPLPIVAHGRVQSTRLTHYLGPGPNAVGSVFPIEAYIGTSGLLEAGWVSDDNFDVLTSEEDVIRAVDGTSFGEEVFHYRGADAYQDWYVNGARVSDFAFQPTRGYMFFIQGARALRWRQAVPD